MLKWFDAREASEFGVALAHFFIDKMPPGKELNESKIASKTQYLLDKMGLQVKAFKQEHTLNFYQTAKLGNAFKWALRDAGYQPAYVDALSNWLMTQL